MDFIPTGAFIPLPAAPLALVGVFVDGRANFTTAAFLSGVNANPPIVGVSLNRNHFTARGIVAGGAFSLNFPSSADVIRADYCGLASGNTVDKSNVFTTFTGQLPVPLIADFPLVCECRYTGQMVDFGLDVLYFGEVVQVHARPDVLTPDHKFDTTRLDPIIFAGLENAYYTLGQPVGKAWSIGKSYTG
jgi:flavin reductase (DIM6/NTAB) family NADH-FMN oxidoreductase RutF